MTVPQRNAKRILASLGMAGSLFALFGYEAAKTPPMSADVSDALRAITPANLKDDLSFLASDALQGRFTPSPGLDVAAEFIASQFRVAGLEPGGDQEYFQTSQMINRRMRDPETDLTLRIGAETKTIPARALVPIEATQATSIIDAPILAITEKNPESLKGLDLNGKAVVVAQPALEKLPREQAMRLYRSIRAFDRQVQASGAVLELTVTEHAKRPTPRLLTPDEAKVHRVPEIAGDDEVLRQISKLNKQEKGTLSFSVPVPQDEKVTLKNVVAILRGSDPKLKDTCVLLTAHYDHIGTIETGALMSPQKPRSGPDHIYNGANDDGSGTVSVIEIARGLAKLKVRPKRSIVFVTFFGEERGELGSKYYGQHPVFPISKTVADLNLEQVGRTDSTNGKQLRRASVTGFDYSDVTKYLVDAGKRMGVQVYLDKDASDEYFTRSDNDALAQQGVPAHTLCVAFDYPDYHGLGDEWPKVDYENMATVDRAVALALVEMANSETAPQWNATNGKTKPFRDAQQRLTGK
jgi:hypothetical protein